MLYAPREQYTSVIGDGSTTSLTANPVGLSLSAGSRYAFGCWVWLNSIAADDYRQIMSLNDGEAIGAGANIDGVDFIRPGGGSNYAISLYASEADSFDEFQSSTIALNTWYYLFWQRISNTQLQLWINGVLDGTLTTSAISTREAPSRLDMLGVWDTLTEPVSGRIANVKCWWNRTLSAGQIKQEMHSVEPVIDDSTLWAWYPFPQGRGRYLDHSGRGHHITQTRGNPGTGPAPTHKLIAPKYKRRLFVLPWASSGGATQFPLTVSGAMTPAGALTKRTGKPLTAGITPVATLINRTIKAFAGGMTPAGAMTNRTGKTLSADIATSGALINRTGKALTGSVATNGTLTKRTSKTFAGSVTPTGAAALIRTVLLAVSGAISTAGALTKRTAKTFVSSITTSGTLTKRTAKAFAGSIASSGALTTIRTFLVALSGAITSAGALTKRTGKVLSADIATSGALTKRTAKALTGSVASAGALASIRTVLLALAGSIASTGALTKRTTTAFSGAITSAGTLTKRIGIAVSGVIGAIGALVAQLLGQTTTATESMAMRDEPVLQMRADTNMVMR